MTDKKICSAKSGKQQNENHFEQDKYTEEKKSWKKKASSGEKEGTKMKKNILEDSLKKNKKIWRWQ